MSTHSRLCNLKAHLSPDICAASSVVKGGCNCGAVSYEVRIKGDKLPIIFCHCQDCREAHSSPYTAVFITKEADIVWKGEDEMFHYNRRGMNKRNFCKTCGTHMASHLHESERYAIFTPSIQEISIPKTPVAHIFVGEKDQDITMPADGLPRFEKGPGSKDLSK
jgi:hypothetical protein